MVRHRKTLNGWAGDGRVWIWLEGMRGALEGVKERALETYAGKIEVGHPEYVSGITTLDAPFYMAFVFSDPNDAMMFKLSV